MSRLDTLYFHNRLAVIFAFTFQIALIFHRFSNLIPIYFQTEDLFCVTLRRVTFPKSLSGGFCFPFSDCVNLPLFSKIKFLVYSRIKDLLCVTFRHVTFPQIADSIFAFPFRIALVNPYFLKNKPQFQFSFSYFKINLFEIK